jgi:hypothetical protein
MHYERLRFDRHSVSGKERRLIAFNERGAISPGGSSDPEFERHVDKLKRERDLMKNGADRQFQIWADRDFARQVQDAYARRIAGETAYSIRSVQDARHQAHLFDARARGAVVEGNYIDGTPAGIKAARDARLQIAFAKVDTDIALMRKEIAEGKKTWDMTYFKELPIQDKWRALARAVNRKEKVPDEILQSYGLMREYLNHTAEDSANVYTSFDTSPETVLQRRDSIPLGDVSGFIDRVPPQSPGVRGPRPTEFHVPDPSGGWKLDQGQVRDARSIETYEERSAKLQQYIVEWDQSFDAKIASTLGRATMLREGPQKAALIAIVKKYREKRYEWGESTKKQREEVAKWFKDGNLSEEIKQSVQHVPPHAQQFFVQQNVVAGSARIELPAMLRDFEAEVGVILDESKRRTSEMAADFVVLLQKWNQVKGTDIDPADIRKVGEELVRSIDVLGSYLYVNYTAETASDEQKNSFMDDVEQNLVARGLILDDDVDVPTPDRAGMRHMLVEKEQILETLCNNETDDVMLRRRHVVALAQAQRAFIEHGGTSDDIQEIAEKRAVAEGVLANLALRQTSQTTANNLKPWEGLVAAQRERFILEGLQQTFDVQARLNALNRSKDGGSLGIIGGECLKVLDPLKNATSAITRDALTTPDACTAALATIRAEGAMLWKLQSDLNPEAVSHRLNTLVKMQWAIINKRWEIERKAAGDDPLKISAAIVASARGLGSLRANKANEPAVAEFEKILATEARAMRGPVNSAIATASSLNPLTIDTVRKAVELIAAEMSALRSLGIDNDRIESIGKELALIDKLGMDVEAQVIIGTRFSPDLAKFKEMSALLHRQDVMVRAVFHADPERLATRMKSIEKQRESLMKAFNDAVNTAVGNLDEKTSTVEQVEKASELLEEAFRQKGGDNMGNVQELMHLKAMRETVAAVREAVKLREQRAVSPIPSDFQVLTPEKPAAPAPSPTAAPKAVAKKNEDGSKKKVSTVSPSSSEVSKLTPEVFSKKFKEASEELGVRIESVFSYANSEEKYKELGKFVKVIKECVIPDAVRENLMIYIEPKNNMFDVNRSDLYIPCNATEGKIKEFITKSLPIIAAGIELNKSSVEIAKKWGVKELNIRAIRDYDKILASIEGFTRAIEGLSPEERQSEKFKRMIIYISPDGEAVYLSPRSNSVVYIPYSATESEIQNAIRLRIQTNVQ